MRDVIPKVFFLNWWRANPEAFLENNSNKVSEFKWGMHSEIGPAGFANDVGVQE